MAAQFADKVVLVTGGGGGHRPGGGGAVPRRGRVRRAQRDAGRGARRAQAALDPAGERTLLVPGPVHRRADAQALVTAAVERFGGVDVLVNSTGIFRPVPFEEQTEEHFEEALGSILRPTFWAAQAVVARHAGARRRRDRQRRLHVGARRDRHDPDERLLRGPGRPPRADQEPRHRARGRRHPRQHGRARLRRDAGLPALHERGGGRRRAGGGQRLPSARPARAAGRRRRGDPVLRRRGRAVDHGHDAAGRRRRAGRPQPRRRSRALAAAAA